MPPVHFTETCATLTEAGFGGEKKYFGREGTLRWRALWKKGHFERREGHLGVSGVTMLILGEHFESHCGVSGVTMLVHWKHIVRISTLKESSTSWKRAHWILWDFCKKNSRGKRFTWLCESKLKVMACAFCCKISVFCRFFFESSVFYWYTSCK